ncbi:MAG: UDP-N-acetylmuramoyl-tripeptide--D-alanyl-D-alanine ligase [Candidatus Paceibacterota bacterium]|jgi:UDP-N-acetylmuramoyl-tripeptide--D-alanyl-D-alanine ligase
MKTILKKTLTAVITLEARLALKKYKPRIIAVTGSVGKTSTKDAIYAIVSQKYTARKSEKSYNSEIGVPLTVLGCPNAWTSPLAWFYNVLRGARLLIGTRPYPEYLVLEIGADHPGDISRITRWARPDIAVLTKMGSVPVHVEYFKNPEELLDEKMALAKALPRGGTIVVNADDAFFMSRVGAFSQKKVLFGSSDSSDVIMRETSFVYGDRPLSPIIGQKTSLSIEGKAESFEIHGVVGEHLAYSFAAARAVAMALGITPDWAAVTRGYESPRGRMRLLRGRDQSIIIDDSYNASPVAVREALRTIDRVTTKGRKIAALGDMKELGDYSRESHEDIGRFAAHIVHTLICVGSAARDMAKAAEISKLSKERIQWYQTAEEAAESLSSVVRAGDVVLIKGSQSMRMERVVKALLDPSVKPEDTLVRQEEEWQKR